MMCIVFDSTSRQARGGWATYLAWRPEARVVDVWTSPVTRSPTTSASRTSFHACSSMTPSRAWRRTTRCSTTSSNRRRTSPRTRLIVIRQLRRRRLPRLDPAARRRRQCTGTPPGIRICRGITTRRRPTALRRGAKPRRRHSTWCPRTPASPSQV